MTVRAPRSVSGLPILARSEQFNAVVLGSDIDDLAALGARLAARGEVPDSICVAVHVTDAVVERLNQARLAATRAGQGFSVAAVARRVFE
jgi:epoxyqueuosine reductase QueG